MKLCGGCHEEICFDGEICPFCRYREEHKNDFDDGYAEGFENGLTEGTRK